MEISFVGNTRNKAFHTMLSFLEAHVEFRESEVSLMCRKISLIDDQGPGVIYLDDQRFK